MEQWCPKGIVSQFLIMLELCWTRYFASPLCQLERETPGHEDLDMRSRTQGPRHEELKTRTRTWGPGNEDPDTRTRTRGPGHGDPDTWTRTWTQTRKHTYTRKRGPGREDPHAERRTRTRTRTRRPAFWGKAMLRENCLDGIKWTWSEPLCPAHCLSEWSL